MVWVYSAKRERLAQEALAGVEPEGSGPADPPDLELARVLGRGDALGIRLA